MSSVQDKLDLVLPRVEKPARYIGGEPYSVIRQPGDDILPLLYGCCESLDQVIGLLKNQLSEQEGFYGA